MTAAQESSTPAAVPEFLERLRRGYNHCDVTGGVLLAVSGGIDSMALLDGTAQLYKQADTRQPPRPLMVAHVNHGLRGSASDADADFVVQVASQLGLPCRILTRPVREIHAAEGRGSLEETARRIRYQLLSGLADECGMHCIATAHHQDDQAETILHHILRGTGLRGLQGMTARRALTDSVSLVRPLLDCRRVLIESYVGSRGLIYRDDITNVSPDMTRNRIRLQLLPELCAHFNAQAEDHLVALGKQAAECVRVLDRLADVLLEAALLEQTADGCRLRRGVLRAEDPFVVRHALTVLWARQNWPRRRMTHSHWEQLATAACDSRDASLCLPQGLHANLRNDLVHLTNQKNRED